MKKPIEIFLKNYPHGYNKGFEYRKGKTPPVMKNFAIYGTFVVEIYEEETDCLCDL